MHRYRRGIGILEGARRLSDSFVRASSRIAARPRGSSFVGGCFFSVPSVLFVSYRRLRQRSYVQRRRVQRRQYNEGTRNGATIIICDQGYRAVTTCCFCPEVSAVLQSRGGPWLLSWACWLGWSAWSWCRMPRDILQGSLMLAHASRHRAWWIRRLRTTRDSITGMNVV